MPFVRSSGAKSEIDQKLKTKRQQIIEDERIRVLGDSLMLFYDKLMENYVLAYPPIEDAEPPNEDAKNEIQLVGRDEVEQLARDYADTKPLGF
ncbi:uncharacterized protein METZ01_LOCUS97767 [marine metagenome]|uniref:Uncharacterized protein n=1 Tax=marine metagenome TaxID=408172 RepID=A0A381VZ38_9ZZZZ